MGVGVDRLVRHAAAAGALGVVTAATYLGFLGWDQHKYRTADGGLAGPYEPWQVIGLVVVLALAVTVSMRRRFVVATGVVPIVLTICFAIDAATDTEGEGLWPIGAFLVLIGASLGTFLVATAVAWTGTRLKR